jgi:hypothetical protein
MNSHRLIMSNASFAALAPLQQSPGRRPMELGTMMAKFQQTVLTSRIKRAGPSPVAGDFFTVHGV